ncbi:cytochrome c oxidase accessory protein FixG [Geoalkalibacter ferrihydriticus]|uniref:Cytochrome c oxidase accessory protein FixG n=1 Tax=Geoalkalibacter ferrihydriticus TaxID=392333 RepID=A0A1G9I6Z7_9BACT|nr:4Fe-4S dicluster domain-containing protein [Geoalkalibacter ferrihydriticus]SDL20872.1 cytochrome c oxidase accessory protein FixG [Geoalkalibacter ferrihydriticus]
MTHLTIAPGLLGPWRRGFQWALSLTLLGVPFMHRGGESLLRLDLPGRTLYAAGRSLPIEDLYLALLLGIALILLFLLLTLALGRAWCGWACPQTTLSDLLEWFEGYSARLMPAAGPWCRAGLRHLFCLALALLVAANLVWYFIAPYDFFARLAEGHLGYAAALSLAVVTATVYLDLAFVRRLLCREFCPYGRLQSALIDPGTLTLRFHSGEARRCIRCSACVRACPMGIDIRQGEQIECINCGRCLDACRKVMAVRHQPGIIRYTFGLEGRGAAALLNPRLLLVAGACVVVLVIFVGTLVLRPPATLKLSRPAEIVASALSDGRSANFFLAVAHNRGRQAHEVSLRATTADGSPLEVHGPVQRVSLAGGERRRLDFAVVTPADAIPAPIILTLYDAQGRTLVQSRAQLILPPTSTERVSP